MPSQLLFLSKGSSASSTRYRALQYFPMLKQENWQANHHTISGGIIPFIHALKLAKQADIVILLRKTFPYPAFLLLRFVCKKLVFDFDDAIFCNTDGSFSPTRLRRFRQTVSACDYIFAGNSYLADTAHQFNTKVSVIPTSIESNKYKLTANKDKTAISLVWIGSKSTKKYIQAIIPLLDHLASKMPTLQLYIIADFQLEAQHLKIHNIPWHEASEAQYLINCDIGLAPLPENDWTKGKCGLKVLQYMAAGLAVITSNSRINNEIVSDGINGYIVQNEQWAQAIEKAVANKSALVTLGKVGQSFVASVYDITIVFQHINSLLLAIKEDRYQSADVAGKHQHM